MHYALYGQLIDGPCQVFQSDMRVLAGEVAYFYPDLVVTCGEAVYTDAQRDILTNPTVIIEVLSPSTEDYDRGRKFSAYRQIPSLRDYLLVAQRDMQVEHYTLRSGEGWLLRDLSAPDDRIELPSIGCGLTLQEIYRRVRFDE